MARPVYLTTTLPYVNADLHIGHALEFVQADAIARYHDFLGDEVFFNTGTDEHGLKVYRKALEEGKDPQAYVDGCAERFRRLVAALNLAPRIHFIRTTDPRHVRAAQEFWKRCDANGFLYKKNYRTKYCVGCELEKTDSELEGGRCPLHPNLKLEIIEEENYFFKFSAFQKKLLDLYREYPDFILSSSRMNEIVSFVSRGIEDFSASRLKAKMPWGIPVPGDDAHVMYVWFDALVNYVSTLGWPGNTPNFEKFWGTVSEPKALQFAGKDNLRQQAAMWQAMLMAAGLPTSRQIVIHGFISSGGKKMSKSLGNVVDPFALIDEYGADAVRYYLLRHVHPFEDSDFTMERFKEAYNANLANGIGNLTSRILKMSSEYFDAPILSPKTAALWDAQARGEIDKYIAQYKFNDALDIVFEKNSHIDYKIQKEKPFNFIRDLPDHARTVVKELVYDLHDIAWLIEPFLPNTSERIKAAIYKNHLESGLFPRKE